MSAVFPELNALRVALLELPSSGPDGFEGLLAITLAKLLGVPFRLAKSGSQFGVDGKASDTHCPVAFEAKRYRDEVPSSEVLNKIASLAIREDPVELWVLGSTGAVSSQVADDIEALSAIHGIATLILDWQPFAPRLGAVLAAVSVEVSEFLNEKISTPGLAAQAIAELESISIDESLSSIAQSVMNELREASVATPVAQIANHRWFIETLSNRTRAKSRLGQALSPMDESGSLALDRGVLRDQLQEALHRPPGRHLISVLGDEGNGKSWLAIDACIKLPTKPLLVIFSPEEFVAIPEGGNWDEVIAKKLIAQTGESVADKSVTRWRRRFDRWRKEKALQSPRLVVLVDGLNQRPGVNWGRHLDGLVLHTSELGACTVVTSRAEYFSRYVDSKLLSPISSINVPPWTGVERDKILASKGVVGINLQPAVADSLLNPRLLSIAITLLDASTLENIEALSVPWLLFEHLRMLDRERSDSHSAADFANLLQTHAQGIIARIRSEVTDDLTVFENLEPAAEGRFFRLVEGEVHRYTLPEQGLTYALGLAIIDELRAAVRNGRNAQEALHAVLDPIAALDRTADATISALTIACLDQRVPEQVGVALLTGFAQLQNPGEGLTTSLAGLAHRRLRIFCEACEALWMAPKPAPNADWVEASLHMVKHHANVWRDMQPFLDKWLRYWWPDAEIDYKRSQANDVSAGARNAAEVARDMRINSLSEVEQEYLSKLIRQQDSPHRLIQFSLRLCAGMPLAHLAGELACTSFSISLTPTPFSPDEALSSLILFNHRDWSATRDQLLVHAMHLASAGASSSGRWAAVMLLRATGSLEDANVAHELVVELTRGRDRFLSWRLVESFCATDPCDPASDRPGNIDSTSDRYSRINAEGLAAVMGMTADDQFVESAMPGLARFSPSGAVRKQRELLATIPNRSSLALRQAAWVAQDHASLIDSPLAARILTLSQSLAHDSAGIDDESVRSVQQALLMAAFPLLSPEEQFAGIDAITEPHHIWLELLKLAKSSSLPQLVEAMRLRHPSDLHMATPLLMAARMHDARLPNFANQLPELLASPHSLVRSAALRLAETSTDSKALQAVLASNWTYSEASSSTREAISGSLALIEAVRQGLISASAIIGRIAPETLSSACARLDVESVKQFTSTLDSFVQAALRVDVATPPLEIDVVVTRTMDATEARYSLKEAGGASKSLNALPGALIESASDFRARQQWLHEVYDAFKKQLTPQLAATTLNAFHLEGIQAISQVAPDLVTRWVDLLRNAPISRQKALRNFGLYVACALTHDRKTSEAIELLTSLQRVSSFTQIRYTFAGLPLDSVVLWWAADSESLNRLRFERLDACRNDHEIAQESAAALYASKAAILKTYVQNRLNSQLPVDIARAVMVAGFSNDDLFAYEVAAKYSGEEGLLATAAGASRYAMDRYRWSKHWFEKMQAARTGEDFWVASVLFLKVVDARFEAEHLVVPTGTDVFNSWWWSVERRLHRRLVRWREKRKKTLFGNKPPDLIYLRKSPRGG